MEVSHTSYKYLINKQETTVFSKAMDFPNLYCNGKSLDSLAFTSAFCEWDTIPFFAFGSGNLCVP